MLGGREIRGRTGTILQGESGANDPVGIALMIGLVELATSDDGTFWTVVEEFSIEMIGGAVVGVAGAAALLPLMRRARLPEASLYPLRVLAAAGVIYGAATLVHGSGFLAVFIAGLLIGDSGAPRQDEIEGFHSSLASLAEITAFVALGLTVDLTDVLSSGDWVDGLVLVALLGLLIRPASSSSRWSCRADSSPRLRHDSACCLPFGESLVVAVLRVVAVEAAPRLSAQQACVPHRDEPRRRRGRAVARLLVQGLGSVDVHVDPDEIHKRARAHRPAGAAAHAGVEILGADARLVEHADAVVQKRDQDAVDHEAGGVVTADRRLTDARAEGVRRLERIVGRELGSHDLDERHQRGGVEEVHADDALRPFRGGGDLRDGESGGVRGQHRLRPADSLERREELPLRLELLDDRLDHELAAGEVLEVGSQGEAAERGVDRRLIQLAFLHLAGEKVRDPVPRPVRQVGAHLASDGLDAGLETQLHDPGTHGTEADHAHLAHLGRR